MSYVEMEHLLNRINKQFNIGVVSAISKRDDYGALYFDDLEKQEKWSQGHQNFLLVNWSEADGPFEQQNILYLSYCLPEEVTITQICHVLVSALRGKYMVIPPESKTRNIELIKMM